MEKGLETLLCIAQYNPTASEIKASKRTMKLSEHLSETDYSRGCRDVLLLVIIYVY